MRKYNQLPPFHFKPTGLNRFFSIYISIYAAHLYDSVLLYAKALHNVIKDKAAEGLSVDITELARNGELGPDPPVRARGRNARDVSNRFRTHPSEFVPRYLPAGREITENIIRMGGYKSISGNYIRIDENGDSEGNFTAFALKPHNYTFISRISGDVKFSCSYYPVKVSPVFFRSSSSVGPFSVSC